MVVWKEESYLGTKHEFKNLISSPTEFKLCQQPISSFIPREIACETLPKLILRNRPSALFLPWISPLFIFTSVNG